ncbi:MAG TPA: glucosamine-6-phosphate deaminase [Pirellulaceae bacterium]|nr:glucosamine-6-phosphate deaminase [Pirellulaceae bacterium]
MRVIVLPNADLVAQRAALFVSELVRRKPNCVLGLATGGTPLGTYRELIRLHREQGLSFAQATTFNLDEYVGLPPEHPQSYRHFMQTNLFDQIDVAKERTHVPDGLARDYQIYCQQYEQQITQAGGIDLQLLGIGTDGHIAFNEPSSSLASRTRLKTLMSETIRDNARFFGSEAAVPRLAVTMGVGTILESRRCLLIACGAGKATAIRDTIEGPITSQVTASALQLHRDAVLVIDEAAASLLERRQYYAEAEAAQALLEAGEWRALGIGGAT